MSRSVTKGTLCHVRLSLSVYAFSGGQEGLWPDIGTDAQRGGYLPGTNRPKHGLRLSHDVGEAGGFFISLNPNLRHAYTVIQSCVRMCHGEPGQLVRGQPEPGANHPKALRHSKNAVIPEKKKVKRRREPKAFPASRATLPGEIL